MNAETFKDKDLRKNLIIICTCAAIMIGGGLAARALKPLEPSESKEKLADVKSTPIDKHEAIKAEIIDSDPAHYVIDVEQLANLGVDDNAKTFAVYVTKDKPETCGDFTGVKLPYQKPEEYKRRFDLSEHMDVIQAIEHYGCVAMKNIPPEKAAS